MMPYDVVIVGGGPGGLSAALTLGRARKRVLLCDAGPRRNAAAEHVHNFVTQDGTPPGEFRRVARAQLAVYPTVEIRDAHVESIAGTRGAFEVALASGTVQARRVLLCTGMVDEGLPIEGFDALWGTSIFQCPYCHGFEVQDRRWGYLDRTPGSAKLLPFALQMRAWTRDVSVFTAGTTDLVPDARARLEGAGIRLETDAVTRLITRDDRLDGVELANGTVVPCDVLFVHPPQRQVALVGSLGLALEDNGFVRVDAMTGATSVPGVYAAGDLASPMQSAIVASAAGMRAAAMINLELTMELVESGAL